MLTEWQNFGITDMLKTVYPPKTPVLQGYIRKNKRYSLCPFKRLFVMVGHVTSKNILSLHDMFKFYKRFERARSTTCTCTAWLPAVLVSILTPDTVITGLLLGGVAATTVAPPTEWMEEGREDSFTGVKVWSPVTVWPHSRNLSKEFLNCSLFKQISYKESKEHHCMQQPVITVETVQGLLWFRTFKQTFTANCFDYQCCLTVSLTSKFSTINVSVHTWK